MNFTLLSRLTDHDFPRDYAAPGSRCAAGTNRTTTSTSGRPIATRSRPSAAGSTRATSTPAISGSPPMAIRTRAWNTVLMLGEQHGIHVNNGGMCRNRSYRRTAGNDPAVSLPFWLIRLLRMPPE